MQRLATHAAPGVPLVRASGKDRAPGLLLLTIGRQGQTGKHRLLLFVAKLSPGVAEACVPTSPRRSRVWWRPQCAKPLPASAAVALSG